MNESTKKVFNNSLFFSIGVVLSKAVGFIMLPVYTHFLSDESYGIATTITGFVSTFSVILTLSLRSALMRFYNEYEDDTKRRRFVGSIVGTVFINSIFVISICFFLRNVLISIFFKGIDFFPLVLTGLLALFFDAVYSIYQSILQVKQNGKSYTKNSILYLLTHAAFNIIFIVVFRLDTYAMVLSLLCTNVIFAIYSIISLIIKKHMTVCLEKKYVLPALKYSLPILPHDLSNTISNYLSKLLLNNIISFAISGLFTVATQITSIMNLVQSSINLAFRPWFNEQMKNGEFGRKNIRSFSIFAFSAYCFVCISVALFSREILFLFVAEPYWDAWKAVPFLLLALVIAFIYYIYVLVLMYDLRLSKFVVLCSFSGCIANLLFSYLLVSRFSLIGAALGKLLSQIVLASVTVLLSRRAQKIDLGLSSMIGKIIFTVAILAVGLVFSYINNNSIIQWYMIVYKVVLLILSAIVLFWAQRKQIKHFMSIVLSKLIKKR